MNLDSINPSVERRALFRFAGKGLMTFVAQSILGGSVPHSIPWAFERDVENTVMAGNYHWYFHGDADPLITSLKQLRTHFKDGAKPSIALALVSINKSCGMKYGSPTLEDMEQFVFCSDADFETFEIELRREAALLKQKKEAQVQEKKIGDTLSQYPLQYVTSDAVGFILGVESHDPGDLVQILGRHITHHFSPERPNTPNHHISFSGVVTGIHCILSGKIVE